jgi:hypothetical protein
VDNNEVFFIKQLPGVSAAKWTMSYRALFPFWLPTALILVILIGWDLNFWLTDFVYAHAIEFIIGLSIAFLFPIFAAEIRIRRELLEGYCTTRPLFIEFKSALSSFVYVDEATGVVLARCDQLPANGEGLVALKAIAREMRTKSAEYRLVQLPRYRWSIVAPTFDWEKVSRPLYVDQLSPKSSRESVHFLKKVTPISS